MTDSSIYFVCVEEDVIKSTTTYFSRKKGNYYL